MLEKVTNALYTDAPQEALMEGFGTEPQTKLGTGPEKPRNAAWTEEDENRGGSNAPSVNGAASPRSLRGGVSAPCGRAPAFFQQ